MLATCDNCGRLMPGETCRPCKKAARLSANMRNIEKAGETRTKYARLGFGKYDGRKAPTSKYRTKPRKQKLWGTVKAEV